MPLETYSRKSDKNPFLETKEDDLLRNRRQRSTSGNKKKPTGPIMLDQKKHSSNNLGRQNSKKQFYPAGDSAQYISDSGSSDEDSEDEEEGRSFIFKSKRQKTRKPMTNDVQKDEEDVNGEALVKSSIQYQQIKSFSNHTSTEPTKGKRQAMDVKDEGESDSDEGLGRGNDTKGLSSSRPKGRLDKKPTNYLDEILSERKKKKNQRNNNQQGQILAKTNKSPRNQQRQSKRNNQAETE